MKVLHLSPLHVCTQIRVLVPHLPALLAPRASKTPSPRAASSPESGSILLAPLGAAGPSPGEIHPKNAENVQQRMNKRKGFLPAHCAPCGLIALMALSSKVLAGNRCFPSLLELSALIISSSFRKPFTGSIARVSLHATQDRKCSTGVCTEQIFSHPEQRRKTQKTALLLPEFPCSSSEMNDTGCT